MTNGPVHTRDDLAAMIVERLASRLSDDATMVRTAAASSLDGLAPNVLRDAATADSAAARLAVISQLAVSGGLTGDTLRDALQDSAPSDGAALLECVRTATDDTLAEVVISALTADAAVLRVAAAKTLGRFPATVAVAPLVAALGDEITRTAALDSLNSLGWEPTSPAGQATLALAARDFQRLTSLGAAALPIITTALTDSGRDRDSVALRARLCEVVSPLHGAEVTTLLEARLYDVGAAARAAAAAALGSRGDGVSDHARNRLRALLGNDPGVRVRVAAAAALGRLGDSASGLALDAAAESDPEPTVRYAASEALAQVGQTDRLMAALASPEGAVRRDAAERLGELGVVDAIDALIATLVDPLATVRGAAFEALGRLGWTPVGVKQNPTDERYARWMTREEQLARAERGLDETVDQSELLALDLGAEDSLVRQAALEALAMRHDPQLAELAVPLLDDPDRHVRRTAAATLVQLEAVPEDGPARGAWLVAQGDLSGAATLGRDASVALIRVLEQHPSDERAEAVRVLSTIDGDDVTEAILRALEDDESFVRTNAILSAALRATPGTLDALDARLADDHSIVRTTAGRAIAGLEGGADVLSAALEHESAETRVAAADAIASRREMAVTCLDAIHTAIGVERSADVQSALLRALGSAGNDALGSSPAVLRELRTSPHYRVRAAAATTLGALGDIEHAAALCEALGDSYPTVRQAALGALDALNWTPSGDVSRAMVCLAEEDWRGLARVGAASVPLLKQTIGETAVDKVSVERRVRALETLLQIGADLDGRNEDTDAVADALTLGLRDVSGHARAAAARGLGRIGAVSAADDLLAVGLDDPHEHARVSALVALGRCGHSDMAQALMGLADSDPSPNVRVAASQALAGPAIGDLAPLIASLASPDGSVRQRAAIELGETGNPGAIDPLISRLGDAEAGVRAAARRALGELGWEPIGVRGDDDEPGFRRWLTRAEVLALAGAADGDDISQSELLLRALDSEELEVRRAALEAIGARRDRTAIDATIARVSDPDRSVRRAAAGALALMDAVPTEGAAAAWALTALDDMANAGALGEVAEPALLAAMADEPWEGRLAAVTALGRIETDGSIRARNAAAATDRHAAVREAACRVLSAENGLDTLLARLDDPAAGVRDTAAGRLFATVTDAEPIVTALTEPRTDAHHALLTQVPADFEDEPLTHWLRHATSAADDAETRRLSLLALERLRDAEATALAGAAAESDPSPDVRCTAAELIGRIGESSDAERLLPALGDEYGEVREAVLKSLIGLKYVPEDVVAEATLALAAQDWKALRRIGGPAAPLVARILMDTGMDPESQQKRARAVETLGFIPHPASNEGIERAIGDASARVRASAVDAAARLRLKAMGPEIVLRLESDSDVRVRCRAAAAIGALAYTDGAPALALAASQDDDSTVRSTAAVALAGPGIGDTERLIAQLGDSDPDMRREAALALSPLQDIRALDPLVSTLSDAYASVREAAKAALAALDWVPIGLRRDPGATGYDRWVLRQELAPVPEEDAPVEPQVEVLVSAAEHPDRMMRYAIVETLTTIATDAALEGLQRLTTDSDDAVATLAQSGIHAIVAARIASAAETEHPAEE